MKSTEPPGDSSQMEGTGGAAVIALKAKRLRFERIKLLRSRNSELNHVKAHFARSLGHQMRDSSAGKQPVLRSPPVLRCRRSLRPSP